MDTVDGDSLRDREGNQYRLIGINAPDRDECLFSEAANRLDALTNHSPVETVSGNRTVDQFDRRLVYVYGSESPSEPGTALVNRVLVEEGLALAIHTDELAHIDELFEAQESARTRQVGLWDPNSCGQGPLANLEIAEISSNPPGPDDQRLDEEYVVIRNGSAERIDLTGFTLRDESARNRYTFPSGFGLDPGASVSVTSDVGPFGFGTGMPIWNNDGDSVIILDPDGRIVAFSPVPGR